jgi:four helix bundle protein
MSLDFVELTEAILEDVPKSKAVYGQLDRASSSVPLNIAEGNGKFTAPDRCRFFDIVRGSALECAAALDVLQRKSLATDRQVLKGKACLLEVVSMLVGLVKSNSPDRVYEEQAPYGEKLD